MTNERVFIAAYPDDRETFAIVVREASQRDALAKARRIAKQHGLILSGDLQGNRTGYGVIHE